jgi:hypothetical protein
MKLSTEKKSFLEVSDFTFLKSVNNVYSKSANHAIELKPADNEYQ